MKTRKIIFALFFALGLVAFVWPDKNVFTASLVQDSVPETPVAETVPVVQEPQIVFENKSAFAQAPADTQDQIDDLLEKIDVLERQIADLEVPEKPAEPEIVIVDQKEMPEPEVPDQVPNIEVAVATPQIYNTGGGGGGGQVDYPNILISEVQIEGDEDSKQEFVELFNPTDQNVDLTGWYLQRKTKTGTSYSSFASSTLFSGKQINAKGYFLIARDGSGFAANIFVTSALTEDNSLVLKNPNGEISDKLGFGEASEFETLATVNPPAGQSIGRRFVDGSEADTDNNLADFEIDVPTPLAQNMAYVAPPPAPEILLNNILISQVQTEGETVKDEFVELQNPNEVDVDLTGFALKKKTASGNESNLVSAGKFSGMIKAGGHFLIAPQDNDDGTKNYTGTTIPDLRYSGKTFSIASGNRVLLYDAGGILMDEYIPQPPPPPPDTTAPVRSQGKPTGQLPTGTTQTDISLLTDEVAVCKYSTTAGQNYDTVTDAFSTNDGLTHTATVTGLIDGNSYNYYVLCTDVLGNKNTDDFVISFSVALPDPPPSLP